MRLRPSKTTLNNSLILLQKADRFSVWCHTLPQSALNLSSQKDYKSTETHSFLEVCFNWPATQNAVNYQSAFDLLKCLTEMNSCSGLFENLRIGAIFFSSALPDVFLSGGDLVEIVETPERAKATMNLMQEISLKLGNMPVLTVTLLTGRAIGGGAEFALATDERWICDSRATLELKQRDWGLTPGWCGQSRLTTLRPAGGKRAASLDFVRARKWNSEELISEGLANFDTRMSPMPLWELARNRAQEISACPDQIRKFLLSDEQEIPPLDYFAEKKIFENVWQAKDHILALQKYKMAKKRTT